MLIFLETQVETFTVQNKRKKDIHQFWDNPTNFILGARYNNTTKNYLVHLKYMVCYYFCWKRLQNLQLRITQKSDLLGTTNIACLVEMFDVTSVETALYGSIKRWANY